MRQFRLSGQDIRHFRIILEDSEKDGLPHEFDVYTKLHIILAHIIAWLIQRAKKLDRFVTKTRTLHLNKKGLTYWSEEFLLSEAFCRRLFKA